MTATQSQSFAASLKIYLSPRMCIIALLGFSSGLPLALTASTLFVWLTEAGVDKSAIGLFASIALPYSFKFLWAPLMDGTTFPLLGRWLGRRRGWILATQIALAASIMLLGLADPMVNAWNTALFAVLVAVCSASQDVVIDAYRVEILPKEEYGAGAAVVQFGYRMGMLVSGAGALWLADQVSWFATYGIMAAMVGVGMITILFSPEPQASETYAQRPRRSAAQWIKESVLDPFTDFMTHPGWIMLLLFIMLYKFGDAFLGVMTNPFLIEIGFTKSQIAAVVKLFGLVATLAGIFLGGVLTYRWGMIKTLWLCGIFHALTNLMFLVQAHVGANVEVLALGISLENFSGGLSSAAFVAFISSLCRINYTATQYALLSSLAAVGRTLLSTPAGWAAQTFGWELFFILSVLLAVPGLALLWVIGKRNLESRI